MRLVTDLKLQLRKINLNNDEENNLFSSRLGLSMTITKWSTVISDLIKSQQTSQLNDDAKSNKTKKSAVEANADQIMDDSIHNLEQSDGIPTPLPFLTEIQTIKQLLITLNQHEAQAAECLLQALSLAFSIEEKSLIRSVTFELIELMGRFDSQFTSQLIALYQSCSNAIDIEHVIEKSSLDPKNSLLTGYLHQINFLKKVNLEKNCLNSPIVKQLLEATKANFNAFKYLNVNSSHFTLQQCLPSNYTIFLMQHNQFKTELYVTILAKSLGGASGAGGGAAPAKGGAKAPAANAASTSGSKPMILKIKTDPFELNHLQQQWREWKSSLQQFNLKLEFQLNNDSNKKTASPLASLSTQAGSFYKTTFSQTDEMLKYYLSPSSNKFEELTDKLQDLESKFLYLVNKTENYLRKTTEFFQSYFYLLNETNLGSSSKLASSPIHQTPHKPTEKIVLLADLDLFEFPLECLKIFHENKSILSITRDFSLQFFATRYMQHKESEQNPKADDNKKDNKNNKAAPPVDKKQTMAQAAVVPVEPLPESAIVIDQSRLKYLIDPFNEASSALPDPVTPLGLLKKQTQTYAQITSKWVGLAGSDHFPSLGERERALAESNCFVFNGTERFLSYFNSNKIASLNLNECKLIIANDLAQTTKSYSRLGKLDVDRNPGELECENHLEANILLSLSGVKCIMSNQWTSTLAENCDKLSGVFKEFLENRQSSGEIVRFRISPHIKHILMEAAKKEEESKVSSNEKEAKKDAKKDAKKETIKEEKKSKSPVKSSAPVAKSPPRSPTKKQQESSDDIMSSQREAEEENKLIHLQKLMQLRKENCNMVCYGLPDIFMQS